MEVRFYGKLADRLGRAVELDVPPQGCSVADLRRRLADAHPHAAGDLLSRTVRVCIDDRIASEDQRVEPGQAVEFLPPLSGG